MFRLKGLFYIMSKGIEITCYINIIISSGSTIIDNIFSLCIPVYTFKLAQKALRLG